MMKITVMLHEGSGGGRLATLPSNGVVPRIGERLLLCSYGSTPMSYSVVDVLHILSEESDQREVRLVVIHAKRRVSDMVEL